MTDEEFLKAIMLLETGLGKKPMPDAQREIWFRCLRDLPKDAFEKAVVVYLNEGDDWPSISKIRTLATEQLLGTPEPHGEAFARVMKAVRCFGYTAKQEGLQSLPERDRRAVEMSGGWQRFCDCTPDDKGTLAAQFRGHWEALSGGERRIANLPVQVRPRLEHQVGLKKLSDSMSIGEDVDS